MPRFYAAQWGERQFGREGLKAGDFISLLIHTDGAYSRNTLTGLVHHVAYKPKAKNAPVAKYYMIREIWIWVSADTALRDFASIRHIHQCISLQCSEKLNVALAWGDAFMACPRSACSIMGVNDVSKASESLGNHRRSLEYAMDPKSFVVQSTSESAIRDSRDLVAFNTIWPQLSASITRQPIVPIVGPPGTGKTRVAAELLVHFLRNLMKSIWTLCTAWTNQAVYVLAEVCSKYEFKAEIVLVGARHQNAERCQLPGVTYVSSFTDEKWLIILQSENPVVVFATIGILSRPLTDYWTVFNEIVGRFSLIISDEFTQALQANALHILRFQSDFPENQTLRIILGDPRQLPAYALCEWFQITCMRGILCNASPILLQDQY